MFCTNCGKEINEEFKHCPHCGVKIKELNKVVKATETPQEKEDRENEKLNYQLLKTIVACILVVIGTFACFVLSASCKKIPPIIYAEETLTGLKIYVNAKDDYHKVVVVVTLYEDDKVIYKQKTLTGKDYEEGNVYVLTLSLSAADLLNVKSYTYKLKYCI